MAARTHNPKHDENTKRRIQASQLLNRLTLFAHGKVVMRPEQLMAAKIVIGKSIPDLKSIEHTGKDGDPIAHKASMTADEAYFAMVKAIDQPLGLGADGRCF